MLQKNATKYELYIGIKNYNETATYLKSNVSELIHHENYTEDLKNPNYKLNDIALLKLSSPYKVSIK